MTPEDLPRYHELFVPTLRALNTLGGSGRNEEIDDAVFAVLGLPNTAAEVVYKSGSTFVFNDRCSWARSYLKIGGFLDSGGRAVWLLTDKGRTAINDRTRQRSGLPSTRLKKPRLPSARPC